MASWFDNQIIKHFRQDIQIYKPVLPSPCLPAPLQFGDFGIAFGLPAGGGLGIATGMSDLGEVRVDYIDFSHIKGFKNFQPLQQVLFGLLQIAQQAVMNA
jgi:hypothetical protein